MTLDDNCSVLVLNATSAEPRAGQRMCRVDPQSAQYLAPQSLQCVRTFIEEHLQEPLELADLAAAAGISRFHFARLFRRSTGESPMRYLLRMRIDRAKQLLSKPRGLIGDIALDLGFYDQSHFTRSFRRLAGTSPSQFARQRAMTSGN